MGTPLESDGSNQCPLNLKKLAVNSEDFNDHLFPLHHQPHRRSSEHVPFRKRSASPLFLNPIEGTTRCLSTSPTDASLSVQRKQVGNPRRGRLNHTRGWVGCTVGVGGGVRRVYLLGADEVVAQAARLLLRQHHHLDGLLREALHPSTIHESTWLEVSLLVICVKKSSGCDTDSFPRLWLRVVRSRGCGSGGLVRCVEPFGRYEGRCAGRRSRGWRRRDGKGLDGNGGGCS